MIFRQPDPDPFYTAVFWSFRTYPFTHVADDTRRHVRVWWHWLRKFELWTMLESLVELFLQVRGRFGNVDRATNTVAARVVANPIAPFSDWGLRNSPCL